MLLIAETEICSDSGTGNKLSMPEDFNSCKSTKIGIS
jgi:hypothetical protein